MKPYLLQHLLLESALKYPDNVAFCLEQNSITYQVLEEKSSRLANLLINMGVKPGDPVGIYLNKSIAAVISFFAVLKAGAVYMPLDATYSPLLRIYKILRISDVRCIISTARLWQTMTTEITLDEGILKSLTVVLADHLESGAADDDAGLCSTGSLERLIFYDDSPDVKLTASITMTDSDLAYILYTSGSTGTPKGVMISHLNALTFINWAISYFSPTATDVFANHAPLNFDLSVFDIYVSVATGARTCLVPMHTSVNPRALVAWISENQISYWYSVPQVWVTILNYATIEKDSLVNLKNILFAGEVFPVVYLKKLMNRLPNASYYNLYGPTETNVCTCYHVKNADALGDRPAPIGKACENTQVLVLNENDLPVSVGEEGELFVRGSGVTGGYYKDPERTASAFKKSPLACHNGALLYRTGDIVLKCDADNYEYIGRKDLMVKCSGFRIELPEIERAIYQFNGIEEAVAVSHFDEKMGTTRLYAFVTSTPGIDLAIIQLKKHLAGILPKYMVPDVIEQVQEIPKNPNGKTDRQKVKGWV